MNVQYYTPLLPVAHLDTLQTVYAKIRTVFMRLTATDTPAGHNSTSYRLTAVSLHAVWHWLWRIILVTTFALTSAAPAMAQEGLNINKVFQRFGHAKGCKMVEMHNVKLKGYELKVYKSLTYKNIGASIDPYLKADKKNAKKIREVIENGQVVSGYYMMPPKGDGINRYILFSKVRPNRGTVIYIEGTLSPDDIMKLCYA